MAWLFAAPSTFAAGASLQKVGAIRFIQGGLLVRPPSRAPSAGKVRESVFAADGLTTRAKQRASLRFVDGTEFHMDQLTDIVLQSPKFALLRAGEIESVDLTGTHHTIRTAIVEASATGTNFDARIVPPGSSVRFGGPGSPRFPPGTVTVSVVSGTVRVFNRFGAQTLRAGQWTHVAPSKAPTRPTSHNAAGDVVWARGMPGP